MTLSSRSNGCSASKSAKGTVCGSPWRTAVALGYSYKLDFDKEQKPEDAVFERNGLKVFVDRASAPYLKGTVIDFVGGLYGGGFKFTNPNASGTCGCGTSFSA